MDRTHHARRTPLLLVLAAAVTLAGCGGTGSDDEGADPGEVAGTPADAADADRRIEVTATDELAYEPATVEVAVGETITFVVTNVGEVEHEFVLGDDDEQEEHASEMAEMGDDAMEHAEPNAIAVPPGETVELTWHFPAAGELTYACHEPGHYEGGMIGTILVE